MPAIADHNTLLADLFRAMAYVYAAILAAYVWDWLLSIAEECEAVRQSRLSISSTAYFLSRVGTLGILTSAFIYIVAPVNNCQELAIIFGSCLVVSISATSFLFLLRVTAVYNNSRIITSFFGLLWVAVLGLSIMISVGINSGSHMPFSDYCKLPNYPRYAGTLTAVDTVNDTVIFIAISCRMVCNSTTGDTWRVRFKSFIRGDGLHSVSKALLQSGQAYYFATVGIAIASSVTMLLPSIPAEWGYILTLPNIALSNVMACHVYRAIKLGTFENSELSTSRFISVFRAAPTIDFGCDQAFKVRFLACDTPNFREVSSDHSTYLEADSGCGNLVGQEDVRWVV